MDDAPNHPASNRSPRASPRHGRFMGLVGLTGLAVGQPLLDVLGQNPIVFSQHGIHGWEVLMVAGVLLVAPPIALWLAIAGLHALHRRVGLVAHFAVVGFLASCVVVQLLKWQVGVDAPMVLGLLAAVTMGAFIVAYHRFTAVADVVRYTAVVPLLAFVLFAFSSNTGDLLTHDPSDTATVSMPSGPSPPIVFIVLDMFPTKAMLDDEGLIDGERFPNIAALSGDASWYRRFTTTAPTTTQAVPSMLSGREPTRGPPTWAEHPNNLFTLLSGTYAMSVFETATFLCEPGTCVEGPPGSGNMHRRRLGTLGRVVADLWTERIALRPPSELLMDDFFEQPAETRDVFPGVFDTSDDAFLSQTIRARRFMDALVPVDEPALYFLHLMLPHAPFRYYPDGSLYDFEVVADSNDDDPWLMAIESQRFMHQARYADALVGEILDVLIDRQTYDESLIVLVSDHGASFRPGTSLREAARETVSDIAFVPLIIKEPHQSESRIDDSNLMAHDLLPTLLDLLGASTSARFDGSAAGSPEIAGGCPVGC